jgi:diaminohydroxyphosphoribosylaminopyrimidine deaminase/5-amino-6-(5-phosphoribosylamino)uracil reductase
MARALGLAQETIGLASPNPQVGCVLVKDGKIVGEGAHRYDQRDHAEIVALKQAGPAARGATAYVTLEPCSHHGRTGPCADALIAAGISRSVIATLDPNPQVAGRGFAKLQSAGIQTLTGILAPQARRLNDAFAFSIQHNRPFVTLKSALSVDGCLAPPPSARTAAAPHWLTGPESRAQVQRLRHAADAILTGIGTVLADDPLLTDRSGPNRDGQPRRRPLLRVILDAHLRIPLGSQLIRTAHRDLLIFCAADAPTTTQQALESRGAEVIRIPSADPAHAGRLNLPAILDHLHHRHILSVLLEAGPHLNGAFLAADLVDQAILFYSPTELGAGAIPFADSAPSPFLLEERLHTITRTSFGPDACVTGYLHRPWPL